MKMGRPKWKPDQQVCSDAEEMASQGHTMSQIALCLGISERTVYERQNDFPQFMQAMKKCRAAGIEKVSNALFKKAFQGNVTAMIYYFKS